jgi:hypothetical protein
MAKNQSAKTPNRRMMNAHLKEFRTRCWRNGQARKQARIAEQNAAHLVNSRPVPEELQIRIDALPVSIRTSLPARPKPWDIAEAERAARRLAEGVQARWAASQKKSEQLPAA